MDVLYYSNYCPHSQHVLQYAVKNTLTDRFSFICVDKRSRDVHNNHTYVTLEKGQKVALPPGLHSVPAVLCVSQNHTLILGKERVLAFLTSLVPSSSSHSPSSRESEPLAYSFSFSTNTNIASEAYTDYHLSPEALSGQGTDRNLYHYVPVDANIVIPTPVETYRPDKVASDVTTDKLQQQRMQDIPIAAPPAFH